MPTGFDLIITTNPAGPTADLRLLDAHGNQLAYRHTNFSKISVSHRDGLFNLRHHLELLVEDQQTAAIVEIGKCIAQEVLGNELFELLAASTTTRTLRIQLPDAAADNPLAAQVARIPWEIAGLAPGQTLANRNLLVRVIRAQRESVVGSPHSGGGPEGSGRGAQREPIVEPLTLAPGKPLRVLCVFAAARESQPLAARREQRALQQLFENDIYRKRRVEAHFLGHGVTRERLREQISQYAGYHVVHWSGHGRQDCLELALPDGGTDLISGDDLLALFTNVGVPVPRLVFLSACESGGIAPANVESLTDFLAAAQPAQPGTAEPLNYTGVAHSLLQGQVASIVAMRYAVGDDFARELALEFYRALLANKEPKNVAGALNLALKRLPTLSPAEHGRFSPCDYATPVLYGSEEPHVLPPDGPSPALRTHNRRPQEQAELDQMAELTSPDDRNFVGRIWELARLEQHFFGTDLPGAVREVAVITGLGGMGKTSLAAEALALWERQFEWVLFFQAKPTPLGFKATMDAIHLTLLQQGGQYAQQIKQYPNEAIVPVDTTLSGQKLAEHSTRNLLRAMNAEPILLVFDNFETNLKEHAELGLPPRWACQEDEWDYCLRRLAAGLARSPSRVLITCRWPLAALSGVRHHSEVLGPLPKGEAALYLREHPTLSRMVNGSPAEYDLAIRLLRASRFHPLLMDQLARQAQLATNDPQMLGALEEALTKLETTHAYTHLPDLFASQRRQTSRQQQQQREQELSYLKDALELSLDLLLHHAEPDARRLLWLVALANEPVRWDILQDVWQGVSPKQYSDWWYKNALEHPEQLSPKQQDYIKTILPEEQTRILALPPQPVRPDPEPLLGYLLAVGLVHTEQAVDAANELVFSISCHELVRERTLLWMQEHPQDSGELVEQEIRLLYAQWLEYLFRQLRHQNMDQASWIGSSSLVYYVQAGAYDLLSGLASILAITQQDNRLLLHLVSQLKRAVAQAPSDQVRWKLLSCMGSALRLANRPEDSLRLFEQADKLARAALRKPNADRQDIQRSIVTITGNWANVLDDLGLFEQARQQRRRSTAFAKKTGRLNLVLHNKIELLRLDIKQGNLRQAQPKIKPLLAQARQWWQHHQIGQQVTIANGAAEIGNLFIVALDVAFKIATKQADWKAALAHINDIIDVQRTLGDTAAAIASNRMNRAIIRQMLGPKDPAHLEEVIGELRDCLRIFPTNSPESASVYMALADTYSLQEDIQTAINLYGRALHIVEAYPFAETRAKIHFNLAICYDSRGKAFLFSPEAASHRLAALLYRLPGSDVDEFNSSRRNYFVAFQEARQAGRQLPVPRVAELLGQGEFSALRVWLSKLDPVALQNAVDKTLTQIQQAATEQS